MGPDAYYGQYGHNNIIGIKSFHVPKVKLSAARDTIEIIFTRIHIQHDMILLIYVHVRLPCKEDLK